MSERPLKRVSVLGSTGSIGQNSLAVIRQLRKQGESVEVYALSAGRNAELLILQAREFQPAKVSIEDGSQVDHVRENIEGLGIEVLCGSDGLKELAGDMNADTVINGLVGSVGLVPTVEALRYGKNVLLANKETIVMAGEFVMAEAERSEGKLVPIDSEMSAIFQCLEGNSTAEVSRIILTASGGPFLKTPREDLKSITIQDALQHPTWEMGGKNTVDSATLMNKGLEVIEARWLFGISPDRIDVVIHPSSIIHSMVGYVDGSILAQLSHPDMKLPIQYALTNPRRLPSEYGGLNLFEPLTLSFEPPDRERFPCLDLAYDALRSGGDAPACLNAANEVAVEAFTAGQIGFTDIPEIIREGVSEYRPDGCHMLEDILETDRRVKVKCRSIIESGDF